MGLALYLFGSPRLERNDHPLDLNLRKGLALLAYVAVTRQTHSRDALATLFWPDKDQQGARANLRRTLYEVGQAVGAAVLEVSAEQVRLAAHAPVWLDMEQFEQCAAQGLADVRAADAVEEGSGFAARQLDALVQAAALYTGDFMAGFTLPDCPEYDEWQFFRREELRRTLGDVLAALVRAYELRQDWQAALKYARRWLALDPLEEAVQRRVMQLYAHAGQSGAALRQYEECVRILAEELDAPPEEETTALYDAIRTRRFPADGPSRAAPSPAGQRVPAVPVAPAAMVALPTPQPFPAQTTPFVGRRQELAEMVRRLRDPDCRLLTLVGPGGIGKTRLALEVAQRLRDHRDDPDPAPAPLFPEGVAFVPLQPVEAASRIVPAIADAIGLRFYGDTPPQEQLLRFLHDKAMLLLLDNFEHLIEGVDLVAEILAAAPRVKLLVTSREALRLSEEWFHPLTGMRLPPAGRAHAPDETPDYDAIALFVQTARRAQVDFDPVAQQEAIVCICRLVDGMPLAMELVAAWLKILSCAQIADEIERSMDILVARHQNMPTRHRSMRAVLDHAWDLLSGQAQAALQRLAVFQGGFSADGAAAVGAGLLALAELVDTAWLYRLPGGRYQVHELLRQYAAERLAQAPDALVEARNCHAAFYLQQVAGRAAGLLGPEQRAELDAIAAEIDNVQAAWLWAIERDQWPLIDRALHALNLFFSLRSRYVEGEQAMSLALQRLDQTAEHTGEMKMAQLRRRVLARLGFFHLDQGHSSAAEACFSDALRGNTDPREQAFIHASQGSLSRVHGNRAAAEAALEQCLALARSTGDQNQLAEALYILGDVKASFAEFVASRDLGQQALALCRQLQRPDLTARVLASLAWAANCLGGYAESERYYRECLAISEEVGNPAGIALATNFLGWVIFSENGPRLAEALAFYEQALVLWRQIGNLTNIAMCLGDYALAAGELGDFEAALRCGQEGLAITEEIRHPDLMSYNLYGLGAAACGLGDFAASRRYLLRSLQIAQEMHIPDNAAAILYHVAKLLVRESQLSGLSPNQRIEQALRALELLALVIDHPATWQLFRDRAERVQVDLMAGLPAEVAAAAMERGKRRPLNEVVQEFLDEWGGQDSGT